MKETFKRAQYTYVKYLGNKEHLLKNERGENEIFASNKNFSGWGLIYKNTHLEFCRSLYPEEITLTNK
jgi:hypothetical protein